MITSLFRLLNLPLFENPQKTEEEIPYISAIKFELMLFKNKCYKDMIAWLIKIKLPLVL